jgi:alpha-1,2-mannosyltransferase
MILKRIRDFGARAAADHIDRPQTTVPSWLLIPGLLALGVSLALYGNLIRSHPYVGTDFHMYLGAARAFLHGKPVYQIGYTRLHLPYTYPPVTLIFLVPLTWVGSRMALYATNVAGITAMLGIIWLTTRMLRLRGTPGRLGLVGLIGAVMLWTEPYQRNLNLGQINILVILLVVADLALSDRNRFKGIGIGAAAAAKLLPGLFIVYLLLTRRVRAAAVATVTFVGLTLAGWLIQPAGSFDYWLTGRAFDSHRVLGGSVRYGGNQSLQGFIARLMGTDARNTIWWMLAVAVVAVAALALATGLQRHGEEAMAMTLVGFTTLLISPVSWSHYWLWIAPMAVVLVGLVRRTTGPAGVVAAVVAVAALLPFLVWPGYTKAGEWMPLGLIWNARLLSGFALWYHQDPYVPTILILFALAGLRLRRLSRTDRSTAAGPAPERELVGSQAAG